MGLDLVETAMRIEEEFDVTISDEIAGTMTTPRIVIEFLMNQPNVSKQWSRDYVAITLWLLLEDELGISRNDFTEDSRFVQDMGAD